MCGFCFLGCPINDEKKCCFECEKLEDCKANNEDCKGMPFEGEECSYFRK